MSHTIVTDRNPRVGAEGFTRAGLTAGGPSAVIAEHADHGAHAGRIGRALDMLLPTVAEWTRNLDFVDEQRGGLTLAGFLAWAASLDTESSASRQHYVDTGVYLPRTERVAS